MPNWCENDLTLIGDEEEIKRFKKKAKGKNGLLDMNRFVTYPKKYKEMDDAAEKHNDKYYSTSPEERQKMDESGQGYMKDGYNSGGYQWCVENWGTKWNFSEISIEESNENPTYEGATIIYHFDTPWCPPNKVISRMSRKFPTLTFTLDYFEMGMAFAGTIILKDEEVLVDEVNNDYQGDRGG